MRRARITYDGAYHHVMNRGIDGRTIFFEESLKKKFIEFLEEKKEKSKIRIFAYCIMDNHFHLVLENNGNRMGEFLKNLSSQYGIYYRKQDHSKGYVFQGRYKSTLIQDESYLKTSIAYTLGNPVKANLIKEYDKYQWSSSRFYFSNSENRIIDSGFVNSLFSQKSELTEMVKSTWEKSLPIIGSKYGDMLGTKEFLETAIKRYNRRSDEYSIERNRGNDNYIEPVEKIIQEFENKYKIKIERINTNTFEGKRLRGKLLLLLKNFGGMKYSEIIRLDLFSDLQINSLGSIYKNASKY